MTEQVTGIGLKTILRHCERERSNADYMASPFAFEQTSAGVRLYTDHASSNSVFPAGLLRLRLAMTECVLVTSRKAGSVIRLIKIIRFISRSDCLPLKARSNGCSPDRGRRPWIHCRPFSLKHRDLGCVPRGPNMRPPFSKPIRAASTPRSFSSAAPTHPLSTRRRASGAGAKPIGRRRPAMSGPSCCIRRTSRSGSSFSLLMVAWRKSTMVLVPSTGGKVLRLRPAQRL